MDEFLAEAVIEMKRKQRNKNFQLLKNIHSGLRKYFVFFGLHAIGNHTPNQEYPSVLNASLFGV